MTDESTRNRKPTDRKEIFPFGDEQVEREAVSGMTAEIQSRLNALRDEMLDPRNTLNFRHGRSWSGPVVEHADTDGEFTEHSHELLTKFEDVLNGDLGLLEREISEISENMNRSFSNTLFQKMHETTEKTGNVVHGGGNKPFPDMLIEMYEKIKLGVDRDGQISFPNLVASPSQQEKFERELAAIDDVTRKKLDAIISERVREAIGEEQVRRARFESLPDAET